jgi:exodeoxyribonuclease VII small subunit
MKKQTFEDALKQLEKVVEELESADLSLEKALERFEAGMELSRFCAAKLDEMEKRIQVLLKDDSGNIVVKPFVNQGDDR